MRYLMDFRTLTSNNWLNHKPPYFTLSNEELTSLISWDCTGHYEYPIPWTIPLPSSIEGKQSLNSNTNILNDNENHRCEKNEEIEVLSTIPLDDSNREYITERNQSESKINNLYQFLKKFPFYLHLMIIAVLLISISTFSIPIIVPTIDHSHSHTSLTSSWHATFVTRERDNSSLENKGMHVSSFFTWKTPYLMLSVGYLIYSISTLWKTWRDCHDFEILPLQCFLAIGNTLSALLSLILHQSIEPSTNEDKSSSRSSMGGFLQDRLWSHSTIDSINPLLHQSHLIIILGSVVFLGGLFRVIAGMLLLRIARKRHECRHQFSSHLLTIISGMSFGIAVILLFFQMIQKVKINKTIDLIFLTDFIDSPFSLNFLVILQFLFFSFQIIRFILLLSSISLSLIPFIQICCFRSCCLD